MKRLGTISVTAFLGIFLAIAFGALKSNVWGAEEKTINLVYAHYVKEKYAHAIVDSWWMNEVTRRTNGKVAFKTYWTETLLKMTDLFPGVSRGLADIVDCAAPSHNPDMVPLGTIGTVVFLTDKPDVQGMALNELFKTHPALIREFEKNNVKFLYGLGTPPTILATKKKLTKFEELKGQKIRATGGVPKALSGAGAIPVAIPFGEIYEAVQRGVVDGISGVPFDAMVEYKFHEVAPYLIDPGIGTYAIGYTVMNLDKWKSLPADVQKVMEEVSKEHFGKLREVLENEARKSIEIAIKGKATIMRLDPGEKAKWRAACTPALWDEWIKAREDKGLPAKDVFNRYQELLTKYESESKISSAFDLYEKDYK